MPKAPKPKPLPPTHLSLPYPSTSLGQTSTIMAGTCSTSAPDRRSATPWNTSDDKKLIEARQRGLSWQAIAPSYFPDKTANACRKRHERLMDKQHNADNWGNEKFEQLAKVYYELRPKIWMTVASQLGERWEDVERKCIEKGLKNVKSVGQNMIRREKHEDIGLETDSSSEIGREERPNYLRPPQEDHVGPYSGVVSDEEHRSYPSPRYRPSNSLSSYSYPLPRDSPTSSLGSIKPSSRTSPSHPQQQLPGVSSLGIPDGLRNGLPSVDQLLKRPTAPNS